MTTQLEAPIRVDTSVLGGRSRSLELLICAAVLWGCGSPSPPNVLLFTFDTTRADFIGCYGKESAQTPNLDRLAAEGILFERAMGSNPVTQAAHATILTGTYPMAHGVRDNLLFHLADERETLAELLRDRGYATGAAIGGFPLVASFGSAQGFEFYDDDLDASRQDLLGRPAARQRSTWYDERPAGHVNDAILPWLREQLANDADKPFFAWLHYWDPHEPHIPLPPYDQLFAHDPYQGEIAYADRSFGTIISELEKAGQLDNTIVVMTADHGEGRMEHEEMTHAFLAYSTTVQVPMIFRVPELEGGARISRVVGTVDVVPTILDLLGFELPPTLQGHSLAPVMKLGEEAARRPLPYYSESLSPRLSHGFGELRVLYQQPYKYIHGPRPELYDLDEDPHERNDLSVTMPKLVTELAATLERFLAQNARPEDAASAAHEVDDETKRKLAALGYLSTQEEQPEVIETLETGGIAPQDRVNDINLVSRLRREMSNGAFHQAKRTVTALLEDAPDHNYYRGKLALVHTGLGELDEALAVIDGTRKIDASNLGDFSSVARALYDADRSEEALELARRLVSIEATVHGLLVLAEIEREISDPGLDETLAKAFALEQENPTIRIELARRSVELKRLDEAESMLLGILEEYPIHLEASLEVAGLQVLDGQGDRALRRVERVLRLYPGSCDAHLRRIQIVSEIGSAEDSSVALDELRRDCADFEKRAEAEAMVAAGDVEPNV